MKLGLLKQSGEGTLCCSSMSACIPSPIYLLCWTCYQVTGTGNWNIHWRDLWYSGSIDSRSRMSTGLAENLPIEGSSEAPIKGTTTVAQR